MCSLVIHLLAPYTELCCPPPLLLETQRKKSISCRIFSSFSAMLQTKFIHSLMHELEGAKYWIFLQNKREKWICGLMENGGGMKTHMGEYCMKYFEANKIKFYKGCRGKIDYCILFTKMYVRIFLGLNPSYSRTKTNFRPDYIHSLHSIHISKTKIAYHFIYYSILAMQQFSVQQFF